MLCSDRNLRLVGFLIELVLGLFFLNSEAPELICCSTLVTMRLVRFFHDLDLCFYFFDSFPENCLLLKADIALDFDFLDFKFDLADHRRARPDTDTLETPAALPLIGVRYYSKQHAIVTLFKNLLWDSDRRNFFVKDLIILFITII